jgi:PAS domain-containing protein
VSRHPARLLLLAPAARRQSLEARLHEDAATVTVIAATPATAVQALAGQPLDLVVLAPNRPPSPAWTRDLARACAPAPVVLVWPEDAGAPPAEIAGVAACLPSAARLADTVTALLARHAVDVAGALNDILARVTEPLLLVDGDGHILAVNAPFGALTGWSEAALVGHTLDAVVPDAVAARVAAPAAGDWSASAVPLAVRAERPAVTAELRASIVRLAGARATWLLRFERSPASPEPPDPAEAAEAIDTLGRRARAAGDQLGGAQVRVIGLGRARQILGAQWARFHQHIALVCESTIQRELGPQDVVVKTTTGDYLVCFGCDDDDEADRRADRLQATIDRRLFGEEADALTRTEGGRAALDALSVEVEAAVLPPDAAATPQDVPARFAHACVGRRRARLADFNRRLDDLRTSGSLQLLAMATPGGLLPKLVRAQWFPADYARLQRLAERAHRLDDLRLTLDLRRLALVDSAESNGVFEDAAAIVDLHLTTVERRKTWDALLPVIKDLAGSTRRWLVPNLVGVPDDAHAGRLRDAVVTLKPFARTPSLTLTARQLATLDLAVLPTRLFVVTPGEAAAALENDLAHRLRERLEQAGAKLVVDGGGPELAAALGANLRTVHEETAAPAA